MDSSRHRRKQASQGTTLVHGKSLQILGWLVGTTIVTAIVLAANSLFY